jgi:hypothetical protein
MGKTPINKKVHWSPTSGWYMLFREITTMLRVKTRIVFLLVESGIKLTKNYIPNALI